MRKTVKTLTAALLALALVLPVPAAAAADGTPSVRISEIMYKNHATIQDADGEFSDWFELENTSNSRVVRLKGWSVSDGKTVWEFPANATIARGGRCIVFASRKDKTARGGELHTSFALGEGETLYLIAPNGAIADSVECDPALPSDHVLRREDGGDFVESVWATPGYPNDAAGYAAFCESRVNESPLLIYEAAVYNDTMPVGDEYYDWIEIKNVSSKAVNLSDYCLSDDRNELEKWTLPDRLLGKGRSILIYCVGEEGEASGSIQAPFALNAVSDTLYLTKRGESTAADYVWLHDIPYGRSMGRVDKENGFFYLWDPTPNEPNTAEAYRFISETPTADREAGIYEAGETVRVKLAAAGDIYYTTDGSAPSAQSTPYTGAITLDETTVLRAAAVEEGGAPSEPLTLGFFIGEEHELPVLSLVTDEPRHFFDVYYSAVKYRECAANLSLYAPEGSFSIDCGVELKGRTSLSMPKKSLGVSFRKCYGAETLSYDIFGEGPTEFSELSIRAGQDYPATVFRNELMQSLCAELDTTLTQRSRYCVLYINGSYWGIYCLKDDLTRQFYANLTGTEKDAVTMEPSPVSTTSAVYTEALGIDKDTSLTREEAYERFCEAVDMDGFVDWVLLEGYCANVDLTSNVRYFRTGDEPWQVAFYDLDWAFQNRDRCFYNVLGEDQRAQIAITLRWLAGIEDFRERLLTRYAELVQTTLSDEHVLEKIDEFCALLENEMTRERALWGSSEGSWNRQVEELRSNIADGYAAYSAKNLCLVLGLGEEEYREYFGF